MKYNNTVNATFVRRLNRFCAEVLIDGVSTAVHVKNTGRLSELLVQGREVVLEKSLNPNRKYVYDLISVYKPALGWVNVDSQLMNGVAREWLEKLDGVTQIKPEYTFGASRVDFSFLLNGRPALMEVKGCTLEKDGIGLFPDAPTDRGVKHLNELAAAAGNGHRCFIAFVIAMPGVTRVIPNNNTHPEFGSALEKAKEAGVKVLHLSCDVEKDSINVSGCIAE